MIRLPHLIMRGFYLMLAAGCIMAASFGQTAPSTGPATAPTSTPSTASAPTTQGAFKVWLSVPLNYEIGYRTHGDIRCTPGMIEYYDDMRGAGILKLSQAGARQLADGARNYVERPQECYLGAYTRISCGAFRLPTYVVRCGDTTRVNLCGTSEALYPLGQSILRAAELSDVGKEDLAVLKEILGDIAREPGLLSNSGIREVPWDLAIPNGPPRKIVESLLKYDPMSRDVGFLGSAISCLYMFGDMTLGQEILDQYGRHSIKAPALRFDFLRAALKCGCPKAFGEMAKLIREEDVISECGNEFDWVLEDLIEPDSLEMILNRLKIGKLDAETAPRVWQWAAINSHMLIMRPGATEYVATGKLAADAADLPKAKPRTVTFSKDALEWTRRWNTQHVEKMPLTIIVTDMEARELIKIVDEVADVRAGVDWESLGLKESVSRKPVSLNVRNVMLTGIMEDILKQLGAKGKIVWTTTDDGKVTWAVKR